jgi:hypothetical protein
MLPSIHVVKLEILSLNKPIDAKSYGVFGPYPFLHVEQNVASE